MQKKTKNNLLKVGILLLILIGVVLVVLDQNKSVIQIENIKVEEVPSDTSEEEKIQVNSEIKYKTFVSEEYGFSVDIPEDWVEYQNIKYSYGFKHPSNSNLSGNEFMGTNETTYDIGLFSVGNPHNIFSVEIDVSDLTLEQFVTNVWYMNTHDNNPYVENKTVGAITRSNIDGREAFQFNISDSYIETNLETTLSEENLAIFVKNNGYIYKIRHPLKNEISHSVLNSFFFVE